ncbi:MAG: SEL1-like repeat protein [Clostridia bacterium]|nr:SEL1-like repeat protein [Clostridia bacterium]
MANIIYTPKSVDDPKNNPQRIYFSCHKSDIGLFDRIAADIHRFAPDAVIAHLDFSEEKTTYDHLNELDDFHLIVIPITENWVNSPDGSYTQEFSYITDRHKAVLPLLFDPKLEAKFNEKSEKMQYLSVTDPDYPEKLQRALANLLIDPELTDTIKKIFTHKMFASYCKEDVDKVQELIRLIHTYDEFRQVSIWYDKYLPTGRNFLDSIFKNLDDSHIFGLTVTPSLINRENFVKSDEYPHAVLNNKKIAIFEMAPTDRDSLSTNFDGIEKYAWQQSVDKRNVLEFFRKVLKESQGNRVALPKDKLDYYLGLAYLNGTFVEIDSKYAIKKLDTLSDNGDIDATLELINIYRYGKGVARNLDTVKHYCFKLLNHLEKQFRVCYNAMSKDRFMPMHLTSEVQRQTFFDNTDRLGDCALEIVHHGIDFARLLRDEGLVADAEKCYRKTLKVIDDADGIASKLEIGKRFRTQVETELNLTLLAANKPYDAMHVTWQRAVEEYENDTMNPDVAINTANCGRTYGFQLLQKGDHQKCREVLMTVLSISAVWSKLRPVFECELCSLRDLGRLSLEQKNPEEALTWFARELNALEKSKFSFDDNPYMKFFLPWAFLNIGQAYSHQENYQEALKCYLAGLTSASKLEKDFGDKANTDDYPITFLQIYATGYGHIADYEFSGPCNDFITDIEGIVERFSKVKFHGLYKTTSKQHLDNLRKYAEHFRKFN